MVAVRAAVAVVGGVGGWGGGFEACACISFTVGRFFTNRDRFTSHWVPLRRIGSLLSPNVFSHLIGFFYTSLGHFSPNYIRLFPDRVLFGAIWWHFQATARKLLGFYSITRFFSNWGPSHSRSWIRPVLI